MPTSTQAAPRDTPGGYLLHPLVVCSLGLWMLNDHILKAAWPGVLTGKLSDIVSLVVFPLLMVTAMEKGQRLLTRRDLNSSQHNQHLLFAILATGTVMATINCLDWPRAATSGGWATRSGRPTVCMPC